MTQGDASQFEVLKVAQGSWSRCARGERGGWRGAGPVKGLRAKKAAWLYAEGNWEPQRVVQLLSGGALGEQDWSPGPQQGGLVIQVVPLVSLDWRRGSGSAIQNWEAEINCTGSVGWDGLGLKGNVWCVVWAAGGFGGGATGWGWGIKEGACRGQFGPR